MISPSEVDLLSLPSVNAADKKLLPAVSGVYFAIDADNCVQYIGATKNLKRRWSGHSVLKTKKIEKISYLVVETQQLAHIERQFIFLMRPSLNRMDQFSFFGERDLSPKVHVSEEMRKQIRYARRTQNLKSYAVAYDARMTSSQLSAIELGRVDKLSIWKLRKLEETLNINLGITESQS